MEVDLAVLLVDLLESLQAVRRKPGADDVQAFDPGLRKRLDRLVRIGLQPLLAAEQRLERDLPAVGRQGELLGGEAGELLAVAEVGVAGQEVTLWNAMERKKELLRLPILRPGIADARGEGADVGRVIVIAIDRADLRHPPPGDDLGGDRIDRRAGGDRRILRIERQDQDAPTPLCGQLAHRRLDRRVAVAHAESDMERRADLAPQLLLERCRLPLRDRQER